ncbi:MAG: hypothetical protein KAR06_08120 [Deltaproteobacteria bacterium]|nr:hypothetical protein [Deltaproteobacteria bacterium]
MDKTIIRYGIDKAVKELSDLKKRDPKAPLMRAKILDRLQEGLEEELANICGRKYLICHNGARAMSGCPVFESYDNSVPGLDETGTCECKSDGKKMFEFLAAR